MTRIFICWYYYILQGWFFIMSKLGNSLVMDVAYNNTNPGTHVISYTKKNPPADNQLWVKEHTAVNTFYLVSKLSSSCKITIKVINICIHFNFFLVYQLSSFTPTGWQCSHWHLWFTFSGRERWRVHYAD